MRRFLLFEDDGHQGSKNTRLEDPALELQYSTTACGRYQEFRIGFMLSLWFDCVFPGRAPLSEMHKEGSALGPKQLEHEPNNSWFSPRHHALFVSCYSRSCNHWRFR